MFNITRTFTHDEWLEYKNNSNKTTISKCVAMVTPTIIMLSNNNIAYASNTLNVTTSITKINQIGKLMLDISRNIGYWVCILKCVTDSIKGAMCHKENSEIFKTIFKYVLIFSTFYFMPSIFDMIKDIFSD